jgi:hypothetical protein
MVLQWERRKRESTGAAASMLQWLQSKREEQACTDATKRGQADKLLPPAAAPSSLSYFFIFIFFPLSLPTSPPPS